MKPQIIWGKSPQGKATFSEELFQSLKECTGIIQNLFILSFPSRWYFIPSNYAGRRWTWDPFASKWWESLWRTQGSWVPLNNTPPNVIPPNQFPSQSHSTSNLRVFWWPTEIKPSVSNDPTNIFHFFPYYLLQKSHKIPMQRHGTNLLKHLLSSSLIFSASLRHMRNCTVGISVPGK